MPRRVSLPSADDLFRPTGDETDDPGLAEQAGRAVLAGPAVRAVPDPSTPDPSSPEQPPRPSGRVRHDEKMTVYVTSAELLQIEHARLSLRSEHGLVVDRGRLVREAIAMVLADLETRGEQSALVARLSAG